MGSSISESILSEIDSEKQPEFIQISLEFGEWLKSGVIGVIYIWEPHINAIVNNLYVNSNSTPLEIVKKAAEEISYIPALKQELRFRLIVTKFGECCDRQGNFRPLSTKLEEITDVAHETSIQSIWYFGAREKCTIQVELI